MRIRIFILLTLLIFCIGSISINIHDFIHRNPDNVTLISQFDEKFIVPVPEFPSLAIPLALIVGIIGGILWLSSSGDN
jgi:hypothetical protein